MKIAQSDLFQPLRRKFEQMAKQWGLVGKLQQHVAAPTVEGFLGQDQIHCLQQALVSFLNGLVIPARWKERLINLFCSRPGVPLPR